MATTWDPAHKSALIALSGANLVATSSAGSGTVNAAVIATTAITGKQYFEITLTGTEGQWLSVGIMNGSASLTSNIAATNGSALVNKNTGIYTTSVINNVAGSTWYQPWSSGQVLRVAVDRPNNKMWWAVNNNTWSGAAVWMDGSSATNSDPNTGIGGMNISSVSAPIFPAISSAWTGDIATLNTGATAFAYTVPSGFVALDPSGGSAPASSAMALVMA